MREGMKIDWAGPGGERGTGRQSPGTRTRPPVVTSVGRAKAWGERGEGGVTLERSWMQLGGRQEGVLRA